MSGADEEWVRAAMTDDTMVVDLLVRLHATAAPPPPPKPAAVPLEWSVRQRRSKPASSGGGNPKKHSQRASPTTPLSWSGATSLSGGSGGSAREESSRPTPQRLLPTATRSKVNGDSEKTSSKRPRKKKTLPELKEEENLLLRERRDLKREIAALRANLEKQRSINENLKRRKTELQPLPDREATSATEESISNQLHQKSTTPTTADDDLTLQSSTSIDCFVLPDLNVPFEEEHPCPDVVCGVS